MWDAPGPQAARVEDANDEEDDENKSTRYAYEYNEGPVADILGKGETAFEKTKEVQDSLGGSAYSPFEDREEWELAQWLINNVNQRATDEFLKLPVTRTRMGPSYRSNHTFMKIIDKLPSGPEWRCELVRTHGDLEEIGHDQERDEDHGTGGEEMELWVRDPVACVKELMGNPAFHGEIAYAPEKVYTDRHGTVRRYDEMWMGDWWWETQRHLPQGSTVAPVILASDKTELSRFKGDKNAWPVYLSIGNLSKEVRRQPTRHGSVLLGYLPVSNLESFDDNSLARHRLFHYCMRRLLQPLVDAGRNGAEMVCADGQIRRVFPIVAAYIGDHPEQCLVACCAENRCLKCLVPAKERGINTPFQPRDQTHTTRTLHAQAAGQYPPEFVAEGLRPIFSPFWADLPHADIFTAITSDILHQLHQGIFKDHFKKWCTALVGKQDFDARFRAMPMFSGLRHFKDGISKVKQWTGADHKQVQRVFLAALVGAAPHPDVIKAGSSLLDFIYLAQYQSHTDRTLVALQQALDSFHTAKDIFVELGCREHFNVPKIHSLQHYVETIRSLGSLDGLNTETSERLHIDFAKKAYAASNRRDYFIQMTRWLQRQEAVIWFSSYLTWRNEINHPATHPTDDCNGSSESDVPPAHATSPLNYTVIRPTEILPSGLSYRVSKRPQYSRKTVQYLQQNHGAVHFVHALQNFLGTLTNGQEYFQPNVNDRFDCFSNVVIQLPPHDHMATRNLTARIRSHPQRDNGPRKPPTSERFDTVLALFDEELQQRGGFHGLRVPEIHVIFRLPPHLGSYPHPLVYVHWFKALNHFDSSVGMFRAIRSTQQRRPNATVIPIHHLIQPCHLIPKFPNGAVNPRWVQGHAMTDADVFYLNRYIDFSIFDRYHDHF
ncbi:hypothetical protein EDD15DRAFT_2170319 [Pisolithus albus]|nr:hypothetical protein EDD15DRAFT_2170319 [Pisolithus albus]